jgi:two-component system CheB/CheR fusion protein
MNVAQQDASREGARGANRLPASPDDKPGFHIVGMGASAGGLESLEDFFDNMQADSGLAFVVIQHLSPDFKSLMDELLSRHTQIAIHRVEDGMVVEPNSIYLIPPKKEMIISDGKLLLTDKDPSEGLSLPIDTFFKSLAQDAGERAVAIVLSGTGSDGSRGIRSINNEGGLVIAQDVDTAKFDGMPRAAQESGIVDLILSPPEMPAALLRYIKHPSITDLNAPVVIPEDAMNTVFRLLRDEYGIDFSHYKPSTVSRRIERRLQLNQSLDLDEYVAQLQGDPEELNLLYRDLLIGVTKFFRDREAFERLEDNVIPKMLAKLSEGQELRVWVAGCATGEEAYSIAVLIHERLESLQRSVVVKVFATDIHRASLDFASMGIYPESSLSEVSPSRLSRYFSKQGAGWQVAADLRKMIVFAPHNIIKDAPFTRLDLITCRNLLIYLQPLAQKKALSLFHFGLKSGGFLFLGSSESPGELNEEFAAIDGHWRIFRKRRDVRLPPDMGLPLSTGYSLPRSTGVLPVSPGHGAIDMSLLQAYDVLLDNYVPPSLLINDRRELIHSFAGAGKFLKTPDGRQSHDVLDMLEKDVRVSVAGALQRVAKTQTPVVYTGMPAKPEHGDQELKVTVTPIIDRDSGTMFSLISLEEQRRNPVAIEGEETLPIGVAEASRERIQALESDLRYTRENLQATIEEMETTNEELQATNEELVASNEELQSTNEELHSVNEQLYTVNAEQQRKIRELTELTDDLNNLFRSTDVGTIFLDRELCIRKFTPKISETFQILPQDVGRRIDGFSHNLIYEPLFDDVAEVLQFEQPIEREVRDRHGNWFLMQLLPYQSDAGVEGVVLTLIDVSTLKETKSKLQLMSKVFEDAADPIIIENLAGHIIDVNEAAVRVLGWQRDELLGQKTTLLVPDHARKETANLRARCRRNEHVRDVETELCRKSGKLLPISLTLSRLSDDSAEPVAVAWNVKDVSRRKRAEKESDRYAKQLEDTNQQLRESIEMRKAAEAEARNHSRRREEFLAMLSHELRNPLGALLNAIRVLDHVVTTEEQQEPKEVIHRQASQMARLLDDLLDVSRVTQGKIEIRHEVVDLTALVGDVLSVVRPIIESRRQALDVDVHDHPLFVNGDPARLLQIMQNLLINAAKYTPVHGHVSLHLRRDAEAAEIRVEDDGIGISSEMLDQIFDLFVQSTNTTEGSDGGMGIGLTLVRNLVELQGGTVTAESDGRGKGSVFTVRLPLTDKRPVARDQSRPPEPHVIAGKIVLVEDNADAREMLKMLLELDGYTVATAADGQQGLDTILAEKPNFAIVDIGLPKLDGLEVARQVRAASTDRDVCLVALTGYGQQQDHDAVLAAGFDEHLVKPVDARELKRVLNTRPKPR